VAHEIRTPLVAMGGFARRLAPHFLESSPERKAVDIIVDESARLERLLSEQLEFARLSRPRPRPAQLEGIVEEVVELVVEEARCRGVELLRDFAAALPTLLLDADQIKQVLLNLVQNGLESLAGGGRLRLSTRHLDSHVAVEVATDGAPIPDAMLDQLFVPFATSKRGGSGLGLAIARQIVREHGGQIRARSESEWGAIFTVILPVRHHQDRRGFGRHA
jgi:signal transduction histidine kinase